MPRRQYSRVLGPTWIESRRRWRITIVKEGAGEADREYRTRWFRDGELAQLAKEEIEGGLTRLSKTTVEQAIDAYKQHLHDKGTGDVSYKETRRRLRLFFPDLSLPVSRITVERCKRYYDAFRNRKKKDGDNISVDYHRAALINARSFLTWCVEEGWLAGNPLAGVKGVGRRRAGKTQHTGDESIRFYAHCLARAENKDRAALGVLTVLTMALRSSDISRRIVRDVDLNATVLRVYDGKSEMSNRPRRIPEQLQPLYREFVKGRDPFQALFWTPYTKSGHHTRRWLEEAMVRLCSAAGVPYVCPHALKGTAGTILGELGASADMIANHLSHEKSATTMRHYVAPGVVEEVQRERAFAVIAGGKK